MFKCLFIMLNLAFLCENCEKFLKNACNFYAYLLDFKSKLNLLLLKGEFHAFKSYRQNDKRSKA